MLDMKFSMCLKTDQIMCVPSIEVSEDVILAFLRQPNLPRDIQLHLLQEDIQDFWCEHSDEVLSKVAVLLLQ